MPSYRIDFPHTGMAIFQQLEADTTDVSFLIPESQRSLLENIQLTGVKALYEHEQLNKKQLNEIIGQREFKEIKFSSNINYIIFS